ncbi:DUF1827 family protein [Lacticaseibacillus paracasei]|uniref:DUF1827 family protein n=1 Tax=Lacticaseibacillus paracasei TaxID=1597 RepID=UPI000F0B2F0C|nr:DUF1827 family protein [Lacticaseibacillus paracasei]RNE08071.1 hypothetical protein FAM22278_01300 [Lacticaseibacillus paracasei]
MRLINVTNSFRNLVSQQLSGSDARLVKVFSLGQTTVVYTEAPSHIELLFTNERRNIQRAEIAFTLERLLQKDIGDVSPIMGHHLAEVTVPKLERQAE